MMLTLLIISWVLLCTGLVVVGLITGISHTPLAEALDNNREEVATALITEFDASDEDQMHTFLSTVTWSV